MKNHDSKEISLSVAGIPINDGRGEAGGIFCKLTPVGPAFGSMKDLNGNYSRYATHEKGYLVSVFLLSTSESNAFLSALYTADVNIPGGAGVGPFLMKDRQSAGTMYAGESCWIEQMPEHEVGEKPVLLEWKLFVDMNVAFISGN
jgi:hypothetical protein